MCGVILATCFFFDKYYKKLTLKNYFILEQITFMDFEQWYNNNKSTKNYKILQGKS